MPSKKDSEKSSWLVAIVRESVEMRWCMRMFCTTCGAWEFRSKIVAKAQERSGGNPRDSAKNFKTPSEFRKRKFNRSAMVKEIISELRDIDNVDIIPWNALVIILSDLELMIGYSAKLDDSLAGTEMGVTLASMRRHEARLVAERNAEEARIVENKRLKAERKCLHDEYIKSKPPPMPRNQRIKTGHRLVHKFLKEFEELSLEERLQTLANEKWFSLDAIPKELIPVDGDVLTLNVNQRRALISRIDRRRGKWAKLNTKICKISDQGN